MEVLDREINRFGAPTFEACATQGRGVRETLKGVALLVLRHLTEKYGGGAPAAAAPGACSASRRGHQAPGARGRSGATTSGPLEVEDLGAGEMLEEIEETAGDRGRGRARGRRAHGNSVVEVPVVLDRSLFSGDVPGGDPIEALPQIGHIGAN